jgi:predicted TIM-barrel fold metal-dependent hydrolase
MIQANHFFDIPIIDAHLHIRSDDLLTPLTDLLGYMRSIAQENSLAAMNLLSIPVYDHTFVLQNAICMLYKALYPKDTYAFGGLDYHKGGINTGSRDFTRQASELIAMGFDGFKLLESKTQTRKLIGNLPLSAPLYEGFFQLAEEKGIPLLCHVADPETFWDEHLAPAWAKANGWFYGDGTFPAKEELIADIETVMTRHPKLKMIFAHFFFISADIERAAAFLDRWPGVSYDITPGSEMFGNFILNRDAWRAFFVKYRDRIVFGTDNGFDIGTPIANRLKKCEYIIHCLRTFLETDDEFTLYGVSGRGLSLDQDTVACICRGNFIRLTGETIRTVHIGRVLDYCDRLSEALRGSIYEPGFKQAVLDRLDQTIMMLRAI